MDNMLFKGTIPLGSIKGIPVRLSVTFVVLVACIVGWAALVGNWPFAMLYFLLMGPVLLFTVLTHELGHCLAARSVGGDAYGILLWPLGGLAYVGHDTGPKADIWVAFAGPLTHIPMTLMWIIIYVPVYYARFHSTKIDLAHKYNTWEDLGVNLCVSAILMNLVVMAFNLLVPAYPLDGGRILADILLVCGLSETTAAKVVVGVAAPISLAVMILGIVYWTSAASFMTILVGLWILISTIMLAHEIWTGQIRYHPLFAFNSSQNNPPPYPPQQPGNAYPYAGQQMVCSLFMLGHPDFENVFPQASKSTSNNANKAKEL